MPYQVFYFAKAIVAASFAVECIVFLLELLIVKG
jgi:hypothetical protein